MPTPDEYQRSEHSRTRRANADRFGLCSSCKKRPAREGRKTCTHCSYRAEPTYVMQTLWRECCASTDQHRFDCTEVEREARGNGPFGPTRQPTAAEMVAAFRRAS